jgi:hypothetical protein
MRCPITDLVINAAHELDLTVRQESSTVAGSIHASTFRFAEGVGQEPFGCQFASIQVAACDALSADQQLSWCSIWNATEVLIHDVNGDVVDRATDEDPFDGRFHLIWLIPLAITAHSVGP